MLKDLTKSTIVSVALAVSLNAQAVTPTTTLLGRVVDDSTGAPLLLANVFVAGSLIGTSTDTSGRFELKGVPLGNVDIVASLVGYKPQSQSIRLSSAYYPEMEFRLKPSLIQLQPVIIDATEWKENFEQFRKLLFGYSRNAKRCDILNPTVIDFTKGDEPNSMVVDFNAPLQIENRALGYKLIYYLKEFVMHKDYVQYEGFAEYHELKPTEDDQREEWLRERERAYKGSLQHFLNALINRKLAEEGFIAYSVNSISLTNMQKKLIEDDSIVFPAEIPYERRLSFSGCIEVKYTKERSDPGFRTFMHLQGASPRYDRLLTVQTSWIKMNKPSAIVRMNGVLTDPYAIITYGYWSFERVAEMLPLDYEPPRVQ
jgi:hypothetical protein